MRISKRNCLQMLVSLLFIQSAAHARASECVAPDAAKTSEVVSYIVKKYQIPSTGNLVLTNSAKANDSCFWKVEYAVTTTKQSYTLYLSPDRKYLSPILYDMSLDPQAEMRAADEKLARELLAGANPGMGPTTAPVTIVEFSDFECPFCKRMTDTLEKEVLPKEGTKVNVVFRNYPLPMHPWAKQAAEIAECAALQKPEAFWAMHDYFFSNQSALSPDNVRDKAMTFAVTRKELDQVQFASCVDHELGLGPVTQDQQFGDRLGVHGTPSLFINGVRFDGYRSGDEMTQLIEQAAKGELISAPTRPATPSSTAAARTAAAPSVNRAAAVQCDPGARSGGLANAQ